MDSSHYKESEIATYTTEIENDAINISRTLDNVVSWVDNGLVRYNSPQQIVNYVTKSEGVIAAAYISPAGNILSATSDAGKALQKIDRSN